MTFRFLRTGLTSKFEWYCSLRTGNKYFSLSCKTTASASSSLSGILSCPEKIDTVVGATIPEFVWRNLSKWENSYAFDCAITGRKYTHGQIYKLSRNFGTALIQSGLKRREVIGIVANNIPEYPIVAFGAWEAGLALTLVNYTYTAEEIARQLTQSDATTVVTVPDLLPTVRKAQQLCPGLKSIILIGKQVEDGCHSFYEMIKVNSSGKDFLKGHEIDTREEVALMPYSSGTTGQPKGVLLTHSNLLTNMMQSAHEDFCATHSFENGRTQERFLGILPMAHMAGFSYPIINGLNKGVYISCLPKFDPETFIKALRNHKPTQLLTVPPLLSFIANHPDIGFSELEHVTAVCVGAAPVGLSLINSILEKTRRYVTFQEVYGMTELTAFSHMTPPASKNTKVGSCGVVVPGTSCKIVDLTTGDILGANQNGEIYVKGPQIMKGYYKNEKATKETIGSGWLVTGDVGYYDEDGFFYIVDRIKELIKVNALQVAPSELEDILRKHPKVGDVAVIGIPHDRYGEVPRAYIIKRDESLTDEKLNEYLNAEVAPHKRLQGGIEFVTSIPKTASGKILRRELKQIFLNSLK